MYSVLNTLSEYTYFYISKNIISYTFLLSFSVFLRRKTCTSKWSFLNPKWTKTNHIYKKTMGLSHVSWNFWDIALNTNRWFHWNMEMVRIIYFHDATLVIRGVFRTLSNYPVDTRRHFNVFKTSIRRCRQRIDVL